MTVSAVGFGGIKLPKASPEEAARALQRALDLGITFVDTARAYNDSEAKIGQALSRRRHEFLLATKTGARTAEEAGGDLATSLRELRTDCVDLWQLHSVSDERTYERVMAPGGAYEACVEAREQGKARHIGISIHRCQATMRKAISSGLFETVMLAYSLLDQERVGAEVLPLAQARGVGVIAMKALSGGMLTTPGRDNGPPIPGGDPVVRGALRYVLADDRVATVIPGMTQVYEVEENVATAELPLPMSEQERTEVIELVGSLRRGFRYGQVCLQCGYCQPCPHGVDIPAILRAADMFRNYPENLRRMGLDLFRRVSAGPQLCQDCGHCEEVCPAALNIRTLLRETQELFVSAL
jgi:hypothetical protein